MIEIKWAEAHTAIFIGGRNLGTKIDVSKTPGLRMMFDEDKREMVVSYVNSKNEHFVGTSADGNFVIKIFADPEDYKKELPKTKVKATKAPVSHPQIANIGSAQVSTPHDAVFRK